MCCGETGRVKRLRFACVLALSALFAAASMAAAPNLVGKDAPDFVLKSADGKNLRLSEFRGRVVLVNFWARWAGDSREEMPALDRINTTYNRAGLVVLGVSVDEDSRRAREFADAMKVGYPILFDTSSSIGRSDTPRPARADDLELRWPTSSC